MAWALSERRRAASRIPSPVVWRARVLGRPVDATGGARLAGDRHDELTRVRGDRDLFRRLAVPGRRAMRWSTVRPHRSPQADALLSGTGLSPGDCTGSRRYEWSRATLASADCGFPQRVSAGTSDSHATVPRAGAGPTREPDQRRRS